MPFGQDVVGNQMTRLTRYIEMPIGFGEMLLMSSPLSIGPPENWRGSFVVVGQISVALETPLELLVFDRFDKLEASHTQPAQKCSE